MGWIWLPMAMSLIVVLFALWPRYDGAGMHYNFLLADFVGPGGVNFAWYIIGALLLPWIIWTAILIFLP